MDDKAGPVGGEAGKAHELRTQIEGTRNDMSNTIEELHGRLNPTVFKEQALDQFHDAANTVKSELKSHLADAKDAMRSELNEAKSALKAEVREELQSAKAALREATVGKVEHMVHGARDKVRTTTTSLIDTVRENPIPAALVGVGLAWMFFGGRKNRQSRTTRSRSMYGRGDQGGAYDAYLDDANERGDGAYSGDGASGHDGTGESHGSKIGQLASQAGHKIADVTTGAASKVGHLAYDAGAAVSHAAQGVGHSVSQFSQNAAGTIGSGARRVGSRSVDMYQTNPLAIGAAVVALGAVVGLAVPRTDVEDNFMGAAHDQLSDRAQHFAHDALDKAGEAASKLADSMGDDSGNGKSSRPHA